MSLHWILGIAWGIVTVAFAVLWIYRSRLESQESDWIDLTDDAKEDQAIQAQTAIEKKTAKLTVPIRVLGILSVILLLATISMFLYTEFTTAHAPPE